jgi:hypothetical protein
MRFQRPCRVLAVLLASFALIPVARAQSVRYVDDDAPAGGDGTSWATAYRYLQDAIGGTATEIRVARGIYRPDQGDGKIAGDRTATFALFGNVTLKGGYAGLVAPDPNMRDIVANETILSGDLAGNDGPAFQNNGENSYHVFKGNSGFPSTSTLDGFTISRGCANGAYPNDGGGGVWNNGANLTIKDCTFKRNFATYGGSLITQGRTTLIRCRFSNNSAEYGAAMWNVVTGAVVSAFNCTFTGNVATGSGGVVFNASGNPLYANSLFDKNQAAAGGVLANHTGTPSFINCTFVANKATSEAGIVLLFNPDAVNFKNCVLWSNTAPSNNMLIEIADNGAASINYTDIQGGQSALRLGTGVALTWGPGNLNVDPSFMDADGADNVAGTEDDDLRLRPVSPCIDAGNDTAVPPDTGDLNGNSNLTERMPLDLKNISRFINDPHTIDSGVSDAPTYPAIVDMGAYEYDPSGDFDHDGLIDAVDNCPLITNLDQADSDGDGVGNVCDNCLLVANPNQQDTDHDGLGDFCDNCPSVANLDQIDFDRDGRGDVCDDDKDGDGTPNALDTCPSLYNPDQADADHDGFGDACDACPNTPPGFLMRPNGCPLVTSDFDGDGDVDQSDFGHFQACMVVTSSIRPECQDANLTPDFIIDQSDFAIFIKCLGGADVAPLLSCIN